MHASYIGHSILPLTSIVWNTVCVALWQTGDLFSHPLTPWDPAKVKQAERFSGWKKKKVCKVWPVFNLLIDWVQEAIMDYFCLFVLADKNLQFNHLNLTDQQYFSWRDASYLE